jgi:hypothetical protein
MDQKPILPLYQVSTVNEYTSATRSICGGNLRDIFPNEDEVPTQEEKP